MSTKRFLPIDKSVFDYIVKYKLENCGDSPTIREIIENTAVSSTSHASYILDKLEGYGLIMLAVGNPGRGGNQISVYGMRVSFNQDRVPAEFRQVV